MIPFSFNENRFSFFVTDHLLVGQLCTNPKSDRSLLWFWKRHNVQRTRSEMRHCTTHDLYRSKLWQQDPSYDNAGLPRITGTCPGWWKQSFRLRLWSLVWFQVRATSCHLTSSKSAWKSTSKCTWMCWRMWWSTGAIRWPVADPWQDSAPAHKSKETQAWFLKECYDFVPFSHWPPPPTTWTRWTTSFGYTSRTSPTWPPTTPKPAWSPSIRRAPASACGKGMLPVPDPYRGGDWGWRRLHWIDVSSTT